MVEDPRGAAPVTSPAACTPPSAATSIFVTELAGLAVHTLRVADSRATGQKHRQHHHLKGTIENSLDRFNIMMPDAAFDQFWATLDASADSISIAQFLSITAPSKDG